MPKMKTNSGAKKRFKARGDNTFKKKRANRTHILTKKTQKSKRQGRGKTTMKACDKLSVERMLCIK